MTGELGMRYGCNPHQTGARCFLEGGDLPLRAVHNAPSYINLLDALNAWQLVRELKAATGLAAAASFKHLSPAGAAVGLPLPSALRQALFVPEDAQLSPLACAYARARGADRLASFGDWIAVSDPLDRSTAEIIRREMSDGLVAPGFEEGAVEMLKGKKGGDYKLLEVDAGYEPRALESRQVFGVTLEQPRNEFVPDDGFFANIVTRREELTEEARRDLTVATIAVKYTQSNSVVCAVDGQVAGAGAGQQSRIHCVRLACGKADRWHLRQHPAVRTCGSARDCGAPTRTTPSTSTSRTSSPPPRRRPGATASARRQSACRRRTGASGSTACAAWPSAPTPSSPSGTTSTAPAAPAWSTWSSPAAP